MNADELAQYGSALVEVSATYGNHLRRAREPVPWLPRYEGAPGWDEERSCRSCGETFIQRMVSVPGRYVRRRHICPACEAPPEPLLALVVEPSPVSVEEVSENSLPLLQQDFSHLEPTAEARAEMRFWARLDVYGLTPEDYDEMLRRQDGRCGLCRDLFTEELKPQIDHCHKSGMVRGLLCGGCNVGLGRFKDDVVRVAGALRYLLNPPWPPREDGET